MDLSPPTRQLLLDAAREIIRRRLAGESTPFAWPADPSLAQPAGCFVSLHRAQSHALRGCIGMMDTGQAMSQTLASAAESVLLDPRFDGDPVTLEELPELEIEVTLLGPLQAAAHPLDFDPPNQGIYLTISGRSGCFLPQVARETGWTREQLLTRLCTEKMGFAPNAWKNTGAVLQVFPALVIGPEPFNK